MCVSWVSDQNCVIISNMIQQLGNANKLCNCLFWSGPWRGPQGWTELAEGHASKDTSSLPAGQSWLCLQPDWRDLWLLRHTHAAGPGLMALCRELQLSKQKMPCPVLMERIILRPEPSSRPLQLLCRSVLPIKQLANEKTLLP